MGDYLVKINGVMNGKDLEKKTSVYTITVQILHPKEAENIKELTIFETQTRSFFSNLKPNSLCLLGLTKVDNNKYNFDKIIWYMKDYKFYRFEKHQEITPEEAEEMAGCQIPLAYSYT